MKRKLRDLQYYAANQLLIAAITCFMELIVCIY